MHSLPELIASVPSGSAYIRLARDGVGYLAGPYATRELACESAGRLVCDVPGVVSIAIIGRPEVPAPRWDHRWYARATFVADGFTAVAGPFGSWRQARADLMELADRGQIGGWHEWTVDYHQVADGRPSHSGQMMRWTRSSTAGRPRLLADAVSPPPSRWDRNGSAVARWIAAGGHPETPREDLLRDVVTLWDEWPADGVAWDVLATVLAAIAAAPRAPDGDPGGIANALLELAAAIEDRTASDPGGVEDCILRLVRALRSPGDGTTPV